MRDIIYTEDSVSFDCECCGNPIVLKKHSSETIKTSAICTAGNIRYWIKWSEGILRKDPVLMTTQQLAQKILEMIEEADNSLHNKPYQLLLVSLDVDTLQSLKNEIKELCQEEVKKR